jgi:hypothetical protein
MKVKTLIKMLEGYDPDLIVVLCDLTTDDEYECVYGITGKSISEIDLINNETGKKCVGVGISFRNKLNPNPMD